jgi:hypothetical protein
VRVVVEVFDGARFGLEGFDVFGLEFGYHLEGVAGVPFEDGEDGGVGGGAVGADEYCLSSVPHTERERESEGR